MSSVDTSMFGVPLTSSRLSTASCRVLVTGFGIEPPVMAAWKIESYAVGLPETP